jgi:hypothetical protein
VAVKKMQKKLDKLKKMYYTINIMGKKVIPLKFLFIAGELASILLPIIFAGSPAYIRRGKK